MTYRIVNPATGICDGNYGDRELAEQMLEHFREIYPRLAWAVIECRERLPDSIWHATPENTRLLERMQRGDTDRGVSHAMLP